MSAFLTINISDPDKMLAHYQNEPALLSGLADATAIGMDRGGARVLSNIQRSRFTGSGPFPASQQRLGIRSSRLRRSMRAKPSRVIDAPSLTVSFSMGSDVKYFARHEFGFKGAERVNAHTRTAGVVSAHKRKSTKVKAHTRKGGAKIKSHTRKGYQVKSFQRGESKIGAHTRNVNTPERRPLRAGLAERSNQRILKDEIALASSNFLGNQTV